MHLDPTALAAWLETIKHESIEEAAARIDQAIEFFATTQTPAVRLMRPLEILRAALPAEIARAAKAYYADRPLPLAEPERAMLLATQSLFDKVTDLYWRCCQQFELDEPSEARNLNLAGALQRSVHAVVSRMIEDFRARQVIGAETWLSLRRLVEKANLLDVSAIPVVDPLNPQQRSTIAGTYGRAVLLAVAQAGAMSPRHLDATLALTALLEPFIDLSWEANDIVADSGHSIQSAGRLRVLKAAGTTHFLNNTRLAGALLACSQKVAAGEPVVSLDVLPIARTEMSGLLSRLHRVWCGAGEIRSVPRAAADDSSVMATGAYAIFKLLHGSKFDVKREFFVFERGDPDDLDVTKQVELADSGDVQPWRVLDRSGAGLRAARDLEGARVGRATLIGVRDVAADGSSTFSLGEIRWVQEDRFSRIPGISSGIKLLPGPVRAVIMRGYGGATGAMYQDVAPMFLLDQHGSPKLAVPLGWWKEGRKLDVYGEGTVQYCMGELIIRGVDFEVCRYTLEKAPPRR